MESGPAKFPSYIASTGCAMRENLKAASLPELCPYLRKGTGWGGGKPYSADGPQLLRACSSTQASRRRSARSNLVFSPQRLAAMTAYISPQVEHAKIGPDDTTATASCSVSSSEVDDTGKQSLAKAATDISQTQNNTRNSAFESLKDLKAKVASPPIRLGESGSWAYPIEV